jgi:hypothetical protein
LLMFRRIRRRLVNNRFQYEPLERFTSPYAYLCKGIN